MINHQCLCSTVDSGFAFKDFLERTGNNGKQRIN